MKKKFYIILILMIYISNSFALTRGDVQIIEATENIQYLGEKITTDYFLLYQKPHDTILQNKFKNNIAEIQKNITTIAKTTKNQKTTQLILKFYRYNIEDLKEIEALSTPNREDAKFMLNISETFFEGARAIAKQHQYESSDKHEVMLVRCKELFYLIESVSKFYMAFQVGLKDKKYDREMHKTIQKINKHLKQISKYNYTYELRQNLSQIKDIWNHNQHFFVNKEETTFPNLILASNEYIKELLKSLEKHHKQNL